MKHPDLLRMPLKSDFFNDLFETYDFSVSYEYDRTHENMPDEYHAEFPGLGLRFVFNASQCLKTLFVKPIPIDSFNPLAPLGDVIEIFAAKADAINFASTQEIKISEGQAEFLGESRDWIRFEYHEYSVHYEFVNSELRLITFQTTSG